MTKAILAAGLYVPSAWVHSNPGILANFTYKFEEEVSFGWDIDDKMVLETEVPMYRRVGEYYEFARGDLKKIFDLFSGSFEIEDRRSNVPIEEDLKFVGKLRPAQKEGLKVYLDPAIGGIFQAKPAFGKTVVMVALICLLQQHTLLLVNKVDLKDQFISRVREHTNIDELEKQLGRKLIGELSYDGDSNPITYPLTVATYQLIIQSPERLKSISNRFGLVLVDECHRAPAESLTRVIRGLNPQLFGGVSATPFRKDGYHKLLPDLLGPVRYISSDTNSCDVEVLKGGHFPLPKVVSWPKVISILTKNPARNRKIVEKALALIQNEGRKALILTDRVEHSEILYTLLKNEGARAARITRENSSKERDQITSQIGALTTAIQYLNDQTVEGEKIEWEEVLTWEAFFEAIKSLNLTMEVKAEIQKIYNERLDVLVTTTKLFSEGTDVPPIDTLLIACPTANKAFIEQAIGRVQRVYLRKKSPKCILIQDSGHGILYGCAKATKKICEELKYKITEMDEVVQTGLL
jgi:superfamily II DNA or RNA helicase